MYHLYILQCNDGSLYTGITTDVARRFEEHRTGTGRRYTRSHGAKKMVYQELVGSRSAALKREAEVKRWPREKKMEFIKSSLKKIRKA